MSPQRDNIFNNKKNSNRNGEVHLRGTIVKIRMRSRVANLSFLKKKLTAHSNFFLLSYLFKS